MSDQGNSTHLQQRCYWSNAPPYFGYDFRNIIPRSGIIIMQIVIKTLLRACEARLALQREDQDCSFSLS